MSATEMEICPVAQTGIHLLVSFLMVPYHTSVYLPVESTVKT